MISRKQKALVIISIKVIDNIISVNDDLSEAINNFKFT